MKPVTLAFVVLLLWSQALLGPELSAKPLSMFREGDYGIVGYALFALLFAAGALMLRAQLKRQRSADVAVFLIALGLLTVVIITPSFSTPHELAAALLLLLLFVYYAVQLILARARLLYLHLATPVLLVPFLGLEYGPWQKALILYLLLLLNFHWHFLPTVEAVQSRKAGRRPAQSKRRVVYQVEPGKSWIRRKALGGTSCA